MIWQNVVSSKIGLQRDYLDVFIANDIETAARVSALVRTFGHAQTEIWTATEWDRFKEIVRTLPAAA